MWVIDSILPYALGTTTVYNIEVQTNAGTTISRAHGQVGAATNTNPIVGPIVCTKGDQTKVINTATGATLVALTINAHAEPA